MSRSVRCMDEMEVSGQGTREATLSDPGQQRWGEPGGGGGLASPDSGDSGIP